MYCCVRRVEDYTVRSSQGETVGKVDDFLFDDLSWIIRYLVIDTSKIFDRQQVVVLTLSIAHIDWESKVIPVNLTIENVKESPEILSDIPIPRQIEQKIYQYYGRTPYWGAGTSIGAQAIADMVNNQRGGLVDRLTKNLSDSHLRSIRALSRFKMASGDREIGKIVDFLAESNIWFIRYLVVEKSDRSHVLFSPQWIQEINWPDELMVTNLDNNLIMNMPLYEYGTSLSRAYEEELFRHFGKAPYWE
jgi:hypothetical protein